MLSLIDRIVCLKLLQAGQRILPVEQLQLLVDAGVGRRQQVRGAEEVLAGHRKEFRGVFRGIGVDGRLCVRVFIQLAIEVVVGTLHDLRPVADSHVAVQWRQAVGVAVEHVQLVGQFVDHQVVGFPAAAGQDPGPGQDDGTLLPGFATVFAVPFMFDAAGIAMALGTEEVVGVKDDLVEALVPVQVAQVQQWQLRLGRQQQALFLMQFHARQGGQVLVVQKQHAGLAQPLVLGGADAVEEGQLLAYPLPGLVADRVPGQPALAPPGAQ